VKPTAAIALASNASLATRKIADDDGSTFPVVNNWMAGR
jgi:hypothetical protein